MSTDNSNLIRKNQYNIGCQHSGDEHDDMLQCTQPDCDVWECWTDITDNFAIPEKHHDHVYASLMESDDIFKCILHGFHDMPIDSLISHDDKDEDYIPLPNISNQRKKKKWTKQEQTLFAEGLEKYGRKWHLIAKHMNYTRSKPLICSHATTYFLKLLKEKKKLPPKVLESGRGYTLSGKPLNKYSATAI
eukprot:239479_1